MSSVGVAPPPSGRAPGHDPRRSDRHAHRRPDGHAGPTDGQAGAGPGLPRRRDRPRRALLHVPPRHGHGDEHARGLRAHELGDRLRRLGGLARCGTACGSCPGWRRRPSCSATRSTTRRRRRSPSRRAPSSSGQVARAAERGFAIKAGSEFDVYVLRDIWDRHRRGWHAARALRLLQRGLRSSSRPPRASHSIGCFATR